jgi:hypothetical protein
VIAEASTSEAPVESFACGPLAIQLHASGVLRAKLAETLGLYDVRWDVPLIPVDVRAARAQGPAAIATGTNLLCGRMNVDVLADGLYASTVSGCSARQCASEGSWNIEVPDALIAARKLEELEDILSLVLTEGWRAAGWVPLHAAAVERDGRCAIVCAPTGGGKTTLTASLVRTGWRTLGDDKLLLRVQNREPELAALLHTFNLHPRTRQWFPEVGPLERLPRYSAWTDKRKVRATAIWPGIGALRARPTRLILLERCAGHSQVRARALTRSEILDALLRQTVIPRDPRRAAPIVRTIAATAGGIGGVRLEIGTGAYAGGAALASIERAIGEL